MKELYVFLTSICGEIVTETFVDRLEKKIDDK